MTWHGSSTRVFRTVELSSATLADPPRYPLHSTQPNGAPMKITRLLPLLLLVLVTSTRADDLKPSTDIAGFKPLFNGKDLTGWDGDTTFWRAENGMIVGETSAEHPIKYANTFLIARDGDKDAVVADFEFHVSWRF